MVIDVIVLLILVASVFIAFLRGFIREVLTIFGIIGGLAVAYFTGPAFIPTMRSWLGVKEAAQGETPAKLFDLIPYIYVADALAYASLFIVFVVVFSILSHFLAEFVSKIGLGALDRTLGVIFGLVRGVLLIGIIYLPVYANVEPTQRKAWLEGAKTGPYIEAISGFLYDFVPENMRSEAQKLAKEANPAEELLKKQGLTGDSQESEGSDAKDSGEKGPVTPEEAKSKDSQGYTNEERKAMDKLIEEKAGDQRGQNK
ncbi:MAG: CvpA family protein [Alphaproteobacteria bacterium]|nr:CvpA family protein [Alphaproteobacteria bacterium]